MAAERENAIAAPMGVRRDDDLPVNPAEIPQDAWEYHVQYDEDLVLENCWHQLHWHMCTSIQNSQYTGVWNSLVDTPHRYNSPVRSWPTVFQRSKYTVAKYALHTVEFLGVVCYSCWDKGQIDIAVLFNLLMVFCICSTCT